MTEDAVKLGLMPPFTGLVSIYGEEISRAGQIACQEINETGGVIGRPLQLVIEDDGSLPESAVTAAEKLIDQHRCTAIIGNLLSNSRIAVAYRVAEPRRIPYLNFSFHEGSILSRYFFHFAALPNQQIDHMILYMRENFGPRMFFAGNNYEWPRGSIHAAKLALEKTGGEVVGEEYCPIGVNAETIERLLDQVEAMAPDVFVPYFSGDDQVTLLTRFTERGLKDNIAVIMGHYDEMMASQLAPEVREGYYSSNTYFMNVDSDENRNYLARLAELPDVRGIWPQGNGILTNFGEGTYACVKAFGKAVNEAGSLNPEALIHALESITLSSPQGIIQMNPEHHHAKVNTFLSRCQANGEFKIIKRFGSIDPIIPVHYDHQRITHQATLEDDIRLQTRMLEQMSDAVYLINSQDTSIIYTNAAAEKMFGYDQGEMIGLSMDKLNYPAMNGAENTANNIMSILNQKGRWQGEILNLKKDGESIWSSAKVTTFTHPVYGEVWLSVHRDISAQKRTEQELRESEAYKSTLFESSPIGLALCNMQGDLVDINPAYAKIIGRSIEETKKLSYWEITPDDYAKKEQQQLEKLNTVGRYGPYEKEYIHADGHRVPVRLHGQIIERHGERFIWSSIEDITEKKQAENVLKYANTNLEEMVKQRTSELEAINHELESFIYSISHDLRTPLRGIDGFSQMLLEEYEHKLDEEGQDYLKRVRAGAQRMGLLIDDMLQLSRASKEEITFESCNLSDIANDSIKELKQSEPNRQIDIKIAPGLQRKTDPKVMRIILDNLLGNAWKFSSKIDRACIEFDSMIKEGETIYFVRDNGSGFDMTYADKLFGVFQRLHSIEEYPGTGVGLSIVARLIKRLGGHIWVESEQGKGATFYFSIKEPN